MSARLARLRALAREGGQTAVEFALVAQVLFLLVFGIYQVGTIWFHKLTLEQATRDGARKAVVNRSLPSSQIISAATSEVRATAAQLDQARLAVTVTGSDNPDAPNGVLWEQGDVATVRATYPWSVSLLGLVIASGTLDVSTSQRME